MDDAKIAKLAEFGRKYGQGTAPARPAGEKKTEAAPAPLPDPAREPERTNPSRPENEFMMNLMISRNALAKYSDAIRARAKRAGRWTWRDIRLMFRLVDKIQEQLMRTMPERREDYYLAYCRHGHYELVMNGPVRQKRMVLISDKGLAAITEAAMESECLMCMRDGNEIRKCPLREALLEVAPPTEMTDTPWKCEYRDAASQVLQGMDVTL